ncbi:MAG: hypothetical protein ACR2M6_00560 [Vampirovibrionia bacterium]
MFKNTGSDSAYVPSKSIAIKPDVVSDVIPEEISRTLIPSYIAFADPRETYIKFNLSMNGLTGSAPSVGMIRPQKEAGGHALFRNVLLRDGTNSATLESLEDYNARVAMKNPFTAQDSISHKRSLFDGVMEDANLGGATGNLYYGASATIPDADYATAGARALSQVGGRNSAGQVLSPQLQFRLDTGLMKGSQVIPVAALQGLRIQLDMENAARACEFAAGSAGQLKADGTVDNVGLGGGACALNATSIKQATAVGAIAARNDARAAGTDYTQSFFSVQLKLGATGENLNNPFDIGDKLYVRAAIGRTINAVVVDAANQADTEFELGVICGFYNSTDSAGNLGIYYVPQRAAGVSFATFPAVPFGGVDRTYTENDVVFYKAENRALAQSGVLTSTDSGDVAVGAGTASFSAPSYHLSDLEYLCLSVQPPESYVNGLLGASTSERGVSMDIVTTATQRFNQSTAAGLTSNMIPCSQRRVKSVFVQPLAIADFRDFNKRSLSGIPDDARNYQFVYGTELIPVKTVPLDRYSQVVDAFGTANQQVAEQNKTEAIHLSQLEGALVNAGNMPRSLHKVSKNFAIARAFSKYNQIADLSEQSLSCRIDYKNTATKLKIFNNYIDHLRRISISSQGVVASDL